MYLYYLALHIFLRLFSTQLTALLFLALASSAFLHFSILRFAFTQLSESFIPVLFPTIGKGGKATLWGRATRVWEMTNGGRSLPEMVFQRVGFSFPIVTGKIHFPV